MKFNKIFVVLVLMNALITSAQEINQFDTNGKRHGIWKKYFEGTKVLRYEGNFYHGKEIGDFKFYKNDQGRPILAAIKTFSETDNVAQVKFFDSYGKLLSKGAMKGKAYVGTWNYYQNKGENLLTTEHYNDNGELHGERLVYYKNGQVAERQHYVNGKLHGEAKWYSEDNVVLKSYVYVNGELHGTAKYYNPQGSLITEGQYKNDKKTGIWKFYENGKLVKEKDFTYKPKYIKVDGKYKKVPEQE